MKLFFVSLLMLLISSIPSFANPIDDALEQLRKNNRDKAKQLFKAAMDTPALKTEAAIWLMLIADLEMSEDGYPVMKKLLTSEPDISSYLYAFWFTHSVSGGYRIFDKDHLATIESIMKSPNFNPTVKAQATYSIATHFSLINQIEKHNDYHSQIGAIMQWAFVGNFENSTGSGFDKPWDPISKPSSSAKFLSKENAEVLWFTPAVHSNTGWIGVSNFLPSGSAIVFAQTFVNSPSDQKCRISLGFQGNIKLWVNDGLAFAESEELNTSLDEANIEIQLKKGFNRIVVQLGHTDKTDYPSFVVRLLDNKGNPLPGLSFQTENQSYTPASADISKSAQPHFAQTYFQSKLKEQPDNLMYKIMMSKIYLRSGKFNQCIKILKSQIEKDPENPVLQQLLLSAYQSADNRTDLLKQLEIVRDKSPDVPTIVLYDCDQALRNEDVTEAKKQLGLLTKLVGEKHYMVFMRNISVLSAEKNYQDLIQYIERMAPNYPDDDQVQRFMYAIKTETANASVAAIGLEKYLKNHLSYSLTELLASYYLEKGNKTKALSIYEDYSKEHPLYLDPLKEVGGIQYGSKNYDEAKEIQLKLIKQRPYFSNYWLELGYIYEAMKDNAKAEDAVKKAITYNPNNFAAREKLRTITGKKPLMDQFDMPDAYDVIKNALKTKSTTDDNFNYLFQHRSIVLFPEGSYIEYNVLGIQINNEAGIDHWKESSFGVNYGMQSLSVEKAEVVKKSGQKIPAERNGDEFVFTNLEIGDGILIKYRIENASFGALRKEFMEHQTFDEFVPVKDSKFKLYVPSGLDFNLDTARVTASMKRSKFDEFDVYSWEYRDLPKMKSEAEMPVLSDIGQRISISTLDSWKEVSKWYSDLAIPRAKYDYNLEEVFNEIFEGKEASMTPIAKAEAIYKYIGKNIRYSSVSFRQSGYVPQEPKTTISTQLGDCKDVSVLYHTLAQKAGLNTHLVLVLTRDNGENNLPLPSIDFNHCIIRIDIDGQAPLYQELTNNKIPFQSSPANLVGSQALVIPNSPTDTEGTQLIRIPQGPLKNSMIRKANMNVNGNKAMVSTTLTATGETASAFKNRFSGMTIDEQRQYMNKYHTRHTDKNFKVDSFTTGSLEQDVPDFTLTSGISIENPAVKIGGITAVKPLLFETIVNTKVISEENRIHPLQYWEFEDIDLYLTELTIQLDPSKSFQELPANVVIKDAYFDYSLRFETINSSTIKVIREVKTIRNTIPPAEYEAFKSSVKRIIDAEDILLGFK